jgi:hypothetical protein
MVREGGPASTTLRLERSQGPDSHQIQSVLGHGFVGKKVALQVPPSDSRSPRAQTTLRFKPVLAMNGKRVQEE